MTTHALTVRIVADPTAGTIPPEDGYWLTIVQLEDDQRITAGEAAAMIDALFDLSPCVDTAETGAEPVEEPPADMGAALDKIAEEVEVDLTACERRKMGTYRARLKIVRSHPAEPYTLRLSVGEIIETTIVESAVAESVDVQAATFIALTMPVQGELRCSWQGTVYGPGGPIDQPVIQLVGNTLFWAGVATGTIRAEYASIHDVVTVEIPGIPNYVGSERGEPQESTALAFYHYQVFPCDIAPPVEEDEATLAEVCGWSSDEWGIGDDEEPEPEPTPPPEPVYGCIDYYPLAPYGSPVTEPWFYEQTCCVPGTHDGCRVRTSRREGGKELSEATIAQMTAEWPGPIEFIGLGPITPAGCGTLYEETKIIQHNCCDEVEPMAWDTTSSVEVLAPGTSGIVGVTGGAPPYTWSVRGSGFTLGGHNMRDGVTDTPYVWIYASELACGFAPITVTDGCSSVADGVRSTVGEWAEIYPAITECPVRGEPGDVTPSTSGILFVKISGKYKLSQETLAGNTDNYCGGWDLPACGSSIFVYYPDNPIHHSCVDRFYDAIVKYPTNVDGWHHVDDHCFYENITVDGWHCTYTKAADHYKHFYEWVC